LAQTLLSFAKWKVAVSAFQTTGERFSSSHFSKGSTMKMESLQELLSHELSDLYSAENQLLKALPKMAKAAASLELKAAFEEHLEETKGQVERLNSVFETLGESPKRKKCKAMEGLIEEGSEVIELEGDDSVKDAALIAAAQRVEHYEMAGYGCARTFATLLGMNDVADLLQETLDEEGNADKKLTEIAETTINVEAASAEE
jgi:ferritin-like metal-binding protein YciE